MILPRRANGIRAIAAQMAAKKLTEVNARQAVSDRIGYAVAVVFGAAAFRFGGERVIAAIVGLYAIAAIRAYRRYRQTLAQ